MLHTMRARFALMGVPVLAERRAPRPQKGGLEGFAHDPAALARDLRCPTLVLHGDEDPTVSVSRVRELVANLPGAKEVVLLPGARHESYPADYRGAWRAAVRRFVE